MRFQAVAFHASDLRLTRSRFTFARYVTMSPLPLMTRGPQGTNMLGSRMSFTNDSLTWTVMGKPVDSILQVRLEANSAALSENSTEPKFRFLCYGKPCRGQGIKARISEVNWQVAYLEAVLTLSPCTQHMPQ